MGVRNREWLWAVIQVLCPPLFQKDTALGSALSLVLRCIKATAWNNCASSTEQCSSRVCFGSREENRFAINIYDTKIAGNGI